MPKPYLGPPPSQTVCSCACADRSRSYVPLILPPVQNCNILHRCSRVPTPCAAAEPRIPMPPSACTSSSQNGNRHTPVAATDRGGRWPIALFPPLLSPRCLRRLYSPFTPVWHALSTPFHRFNLFCFPYSDSCAWHAIPWNFIFEISYQFVLPYTLCPSKQECKIPGISLRTTAVDCRASQRDVSRHTLPPSYLNSIARVLLCSHAAGTRASRLLSWGKKCDNVWPILHALAER